MKKVGKTTRPFRYDLNKIPYGYAVKVRNSFKGLDLIDRELDELWTELCDSTGDRDQDHPRGGGGEAKKQNSCLRRPYNSCE